MKNKITKDVFDNWNKPISKKNRLYAKSKGIVLEKDAKAKDGIFPIVLTEKSIKNTVDSLKKINMDLADFYKFNKHGMRCDDFTKVHEGKHVLFAGCSITAGEGMFQEYTWPHIVYSKLEKEDNLSGYFNISNPGFSIISIIWQIYGYMASFGTPDVIFVNFPDIDRELRVLKAGDLKNKKASDEFSGMLAYGYYSMFYQFCKQKNIKLVSLTWTDLQDQPKTSISDFRKDFMDFNYMTSKERNKKIYEFCEANKDHRFKDFLILALDKGHPGIAEQASLADFAYEIYKKDIK
jgi:hypothetical protein